MITRSTGAGGQNKNGRRWKVGLDAGGQGRRWEARPRCRLAGAPVERPERRCIGAPVGRPARTPVGGAGVAGIPNRENYFQTKDKICAMFPSFARKATRYQ